MSGFLIIDFTTKVYHGGEAASPGFNPGAEEYNDPREAGRLGFAPSPGPRIRQTFTSPPLKVVPKIKHASEET